MAVQVDRFPKKAKSYETNQPPCLLDNSLVSIPFGISVMTRELRSILNLPGRKTAQEKDLQQKSDTGNGEASSTPPRSPAARHVNYHCGHELESVITTLAC
jgi:hypothetical protein